LSGFLQEYFAGELPDHVSSEFAVHLHACGICTVFVEQYRRTIEVGRIVRIEDDLGDVPEELVSAIVAALRATPDAP
jgi:hypothetical protein